MKGGLGGRLRPHTPHRRKEAGLGEAQGAGMGGRNPAVGGGPRGSWSRGEQRGGCRLEPVGFTARENQRKLHNSGWDKRNLPQGNTPPGRVTSSKAARKGWAENGGRDLRYLLYLWEKGQQREKAKATQGRAFVIHTSLSLGFAPPWVMLPSTGCPKGESGTL